jgi:hypothetical protein
MSADVRLPLCAMSEGNQQRLRKTLDRYEQDRQGASLPQAKVA